MGSRSEMAGKQATKLVSKQTSERAKKYVIDHFWSRNSCTYPCRRKEKVKEERHLMSWSTVSVR